MTSSQMETLFLEKCGLYAHQNSVAVDPKTARVVLVATLDGYLKETYPSAYNKVMEHYQSLDYFLKNQGRDIIRSGSIKSWQNWNYEIQTMQNYYMDKRHDHDCFSKLRIPLDGNHSLFIFYSRDEKRRYEAERAELNRKVKKEQERADRDAFEQNNIRLSQQMQNMANHLDPISEEIISLCRVLTPTQKCTDDIKYLKKRIQNMLNQVWPGLNYRVAIFGSSANSLALHDADVDFCIVVPETKHEQDLRQFKNRLSKQPRSIYNMFFLAARLREMGMRNVEAIGHASVPICKFVDGQTGLECDINAHNILGIENTKMIQKYCELDARIRPLIFAVKQFVKQKKINNPRGGTLSSYAYVIMILHFLMAGLDEPVIPCLQDLQIYCGVRHCNYKNSKPVSLFHDHQMIKCDARYHDCVYIHNTRTTDYEMIHPNATTMWEGKNADSISVLLTKFFQFYANPQNYFVSIITEDGSIFRPHDISINNRCDFVVQDPFIRSKNVARSCTATGFNAILCEFQRASRLLTEGGHRFSTICDVGSNIPRPVDTDSMDYRFLQKQQQQEHQRQNRGIQEKDKVIGYLSEDESPTWDEQEGVEEGGENHWPSYQSATQNGHDNHLISNSTTTNITSNLFEHQKRLSKDIDITNIYRFNQPAIHMEAQKTTLEKDTKINGSQAAELLKTQKQQISLKTTTTNQNDTLNTESNNNIVHDVLTPFFFDEQDQQTETITDLEPILNLVRKLMKLQPQAENDNTFESYTSKPCTNMSKLLEDPTITTIKPKDIVYLIAQLNFLGDAVADKIVSNSKTGVIKPVQNATIPLVEKTIKTTTTAINEINHTSGSSTTYVEPFTDTEASLLYVKQLQEMMNSVNLSEDEEEWKGYYHDQGHHDDEKEEEWKGYQKQEEDEESKMKYQEDEEVHIEYIVQDAPEQIDGYEVYNILQWYGKITEIKLMEATSWKLDMVLPFGNIKLLPTSLDFGDCQVKGFAKITV